MKNSETTAPTDIDSIRLRQRPRPVAKAEGGSSSETFLATQIELVPISELKPYKRELRKHSEKQLQKLSLGIDEAGFLVPMLVDPDGIIIAGHARLLAAKRLGLKLVPIIRVKHLSADKVRGVRIGDSVISDLAEWNDVEFAVELDELRTIEFNTKTELLVLTGLETGEIDARLEILDQRPEKDDPADQAPEPAKGPTVSKVGDLWYLGQHRLLCGSSLDEQSYVTLLGDALVDAVWNDPPYNVSARHIGGLGKTQHPDFAMAYGEMELKEFIQFLATYLALTKRHSVPGSINFNCMDALHSFELLSAAREVDLTHKTTCTWAKKSASLGGIYRNQTEFVFVFKNGGNEVAHQNNVQLGKFGRNRSTLWSYRGVNSFGRGRMEELSSHPTVKPWAMVADALKDVTRHGESVLDAFCGSGTTIIAAEKAGRIGYGIELAPIYVDVAIRRFEKVTGKEAVHAETGLTFAETIQSRLSAAA